MCLEHAFFTRRLVFYTNTNQGDKKKKIVVLQENLEKCEGKCTSSTNNLIDDTTLLIKVFWLYLVMLSNTPNNITMAIVFIYMHTPQTNYIKYLSDNESQFVTGIIILLFAYIEAINSIYINTNYSWNSITYFGRLIWIL